MRKMRETGAKTALALFFVRCLGTQCALSRGFGFLFGPRLLHSFWLVVRLFLPKAPFHRRDCSKKASVSTLWATMPVRPPLSPAMFRKLLLTQGPFYGVDSHIWPPHNTTVRSRFSRAYPAPAGLYF